jgi:hypothetical protein
MSLTKNRIIPIVWIPVGKCRIPCKQWQLYYMPWIVFDTLMCGFCLQSYPRNHLMIKYMYKTQMQKQCHSARLGAKTWCYIIMELESCQKKTHTQNVFYSRTTIHTHTKRALLTQNDSLTNSVWFANTKHHSQTNAFCFRNKYSMFYTYKETYFFKYKRISSKHKLKSF